MEKKPLNEAIPNGDDMKMLICFLVLLFGCSSTKKVKAVYENYYNQFEKHYGFEAKKIISEFRFELHSNTSARAYCRYDNVKSRTLIVNVSANSKLAQLIYLCENWIPTSSYNYIKPIYYWSNDD